MAKAKKTTGRSITEFTAAHDPTFEVSTPSTVFDRPLPKGVKRFIVTAAQNGTPVHAGFWAVLEHMAHSLAAQIIVIPLRYKNPTSQWTGSQQNAEYWVGEVRPYLWNQRYALNANLTLLADMKIQPTAVEPLNGADALSLQSSGIIGHTKVQLKCVPTPSSRMAKILMTTGACTVPNYTDSRSGRIGEFHHSLSAVMVELDGKQFFARHVHFDSRTKSVTDLNWRYYAMSRYPAPRPEALTMGDTHVDYVDPGVQSATFGKGGMVEVLRPQRLIWHDLLDGYSCNPHHAGNPFNRVAKRKANADRVKDEVTRAAIHALRWTPADTESIIVASNHNDFLRRWINSNDWRMDPENAEFYLQTALEMVRGTKLTARGTEYPDPFSFWFKRVHMKHYPKKQARVLDLDESLVVQGVALDMHGDRGPNGSRGSIRNLRRLGVKSIIGHSHSPGINEGCYQAGTSTLLKLEYNHGASAWLNAHCILHADGKRQLIPIIDGKWRLTV